LDGFWQIVLQLAAGVPDHGVAVLLVQLDDPVVAPERPEETHLQFGVGGGVDHPRPALGDILLAVETFQEAAVDHVDIAVLAQRVPGGGAGTALLETVRKAGDLVPCAHIARNVDPLYRLQRRQSLALGGAGPATREEGKKTQTAGRFQ